MSFLRDIQVFVLALNWRFVGFDIYFIEFYFIEFYFLFLSFVLGLDVERLLC